MTIPDEIFYKAVQSADDRSFWVLTKHNEIRLSLMFKNLFLTKNGELRTEFSGFENKIDEVHKNGDVLKSCKL